MPRQQSEKDNAALHLLGFTTPTKANRNDGARMLKEPKPNQLPTSRENSRIQRARIRRIRRIRPVISFEMIVLKKKRGVV